MVTGLVGRPEKVAGPAFFLFLLFGLTTAQSRSPPGKVKYF